MEKRATLLIVDNVEIDRAILRGIFENEFHILEADDGTTALDTLHDEHNAVDIILLDIIMPGMNGVEFLRLIKKDDRYKGIPVIINTSDDSGTYENEAMELGADHFMTKPYNPNLLKKRVRTIMDNYVSKRLHVEETLRHTTSRLETLIDTVPGGIGIFEKTDIMRTVFLMADCATSWDIRRRNLVLWSRRMYLISSMHLIGSC